MSLLGVKQRIEEAYQLYFKYWNSLSVTKIIDTISKEMHEEPSCVRGWIYKDKFKERAEREHLLVSAGVTDAITKRVIEQYDGLLNNLKPLLEKFVKTKLPIDSYKTFNETMNTYIKMVESLKTDGNNAKSNTTIIVISNTPRPGSESEQNIIEIPAYTETEDSTPSDGT